jgi:leucyl-tRNA synthetase
MLPFNEAQILKEISPYLKKTLGLVDVEIYSVADAKAKEGAGFTASIIESSEPGGPAFEYRNV